MARFEPFRPTLYEATRVTADDVVAPPYDVVGPAERSALAARSPYNAIRVELPVRGDYGEVADPYEGAAGLFASWHDEGVVAAAAEPVFAIYRMTFRDEDGAVRATTGVLGALGLDPAGRGEVLPHEQTTPKDKHDRLSLLRAARTNFSPIWGLTLAAGFGAACEAAIAGAADPWRAVDDEGVVHERWIVSDPEVVDRLRSLVATTPVLIADGHHRYETACAYLGERPEGRGAGAILALVVELSESELSVQAIHRLVRGVDGGGFVSDLAEFFAARPGPADPVALRDAMAAEGALGLVTAAGSWLLAPRSALDAMAGDDLDSSRLAAALERLGVVDVTYQHGARQAAEAVAGGMADAAVLLRPVSVSRIAETAHGGRRMPPKSTFFHPKPRTGMVFRELERS